MSFDTLPESHHLSTKHLPPPVARDPQLHYRRIAEACKIASISRRTMYNWLIAGKVPYIRNAGGSILIPEEHLFLSAAQSAAINQRRSDQAAANYRKGRQRQDEEDLLCDGDPARAE